MNFIILDIVSLSKQTTSYIHSGHSHVAYQCIQAITSYHNLQ